MDFNISKLGMDAICMFLSKVYELALYFCMLHLVLSNVDFIYFHFAYILPILRKIGLPEYTWNVLFNCIFQSITLIIREQFFVN